MTLPKKPCAVQGQWPCRSPRMLDLEGRPDATYWEATRAHLLAGTSFGLTDGTRGGGRGGRHFASLRADLVDAQLRAGSRSRGRCTPAVGLPPSSAAPGTAKGLTAVHPTMTRWRSVLRGPVSLVCPSIGWESLTSLICGEAASEISPDVRSKGAAVSPCTLR